MRQHPAQVSPGGPPTPRQRAAAHRRRTRALAVAGFVAVAVAANLAWFLLFLPAGGRPENYWPLWVMLVAAVPAVAMWVAPDGPAIDSSDAPERRGVNQEGRPGGIDASF